MVSLWPGAVKTEYIQDKVMNADTANPMKAVFEKGETIEFAGKAIVALAADENVIKKTGRILQTRELANEYSFQEDDGRLPPDMRQVKNLLAYAGYGWLSYVVPSFIRIPMWVMHFGSYKF
jgi:dehydrogenase/reductase SDR family protein 1